MRPGWGLGARVPPPAVGLSSSSAPRPDQDPRGERTAPQRPPPHGWEGEGCVVLPAPREAGVGACLRAGRDKLNSGGHRRPALSTSEPPHTPWPTTWAQHQGLRLPAAGDGAGRNSVGSDRYRTRHRLSASPFRSRVRPRGAAPHPHTSSGSRSTRREAIPLFPHDRMKLFHFEARLPSCALPGNLGQFLSSENSQPLEEANGSCRLEPAGRGSARPGHCPRRHQGSLGRGLRSGHGRCFCPRRWHSARGRGRGWRRHTHAEGGPLCSHPQPRPPQAPQEPVQLPSDGASSWGLVMPKRPRTAPQKLPLRLGSQLPLRMDTPCPGTPHPNLSPAAALPSQPGSGSPWPWRRL